MHEASQSSLVLVVDDHDLVRNLVVNILQSDGIETLAAANGKEALEHFDAQRERIGCVLLDLSMPGMNGPQVLKEIRARDPSRPVLMMSAHDESTAAILLPEVKPDGYLRKPFRPDELIATVRDILG